MNKIINHILSNDVFSDEIRKQVILHIPHSKTNIPFYDGFNLDLVEQETNLLVDIGTDEIFNIEGVDSLIFEHNRIFCDVERLSDELEPLFDKGRGFYYTNTDSGKTLREVIPGLKEKIKKDFYDVHHSKLETLTQDKLNKYNNVLIIDCHSFTDIPFESDLDKSPDRPDICLGVDSFHTPKWLVEQLETGFKYHNFSVKINSPYSGTIIPLKYYELDNRVKGIMIEINRKLYLKNGLVDKTQVENLNEVISKILF